MWFSIDHFTEALLGFHYGTQTRTFQWLVLSIMKYSYNDYLCCQQPAFIASHKHYSQHWLYTILILQLSWRLNKYYLSLMSNRSKRYGITRNRRNVAFFLWFIHLFPRDHSYWLEWNRIHRNKDCSVVMWQYVYHTNRHLQLSYGWINK